MASVIEICNMALANIGKEHINALDEGSTESRACDRFYAQTRDTLLASFPWRFASKTVSLAEITNDKPDLWSYCYSRPIDCLRVRWIISDPTDGHDCVIPDGFRRQYGHLYCLEAARVYCDISPAFMGYTAKVEDPSLFPPLFTEALIWNLSVRIAMPLTRDARVRADAWQVAQNMMMAAQNADASEERQVYDHLSEFVEAR